MANPVKLPVVRLGQKPGLCGAACAQMILNAKGKVGKSKAVEDQMWNEIKGNTTPGGTGPVTVVPLCGTFPHQVIEPCQSGPLCWCTYPTALAATINDHLGANTVKAVPDAEITGAGITARAIASITSGVAPAILVYQASHWVVLYGYRTGATGTTLTVNGLQISDVYVHDPDWPAPQTIWPIENWTSHYLAPLPACGFYGGFQVMVGVDHGPQIIGGTAQPAYAERGLSPVIDVLQMLELARQDAAELGRTTEWSAAFSNAEARTPMLVGDPTSSGRDYYIVDVRTGERPTARMIYDPRTGNRACVTGIAETSDYLPDFMVESNARLVWTPCDQSHTPFLPFYELEKDERYLRVDGVTFRAPTKAGAGA